MTYAPVTFAPSALASRTAVRTAFADNLEPSVETRMCLYILGLRPLGWAGCSVARRPRSRLTCIKMGPARRRKVSGKGDQSMYSHVLIPSDGSEVADKGVKAGIEFARNVGARITAFTAVPEFELPGQAELMSHKRVQSPWEHEERVRRHAQQILTAIAERAAAAGVECDGDYALCNRPGEAIIDAAKKHNCDL